MTGAPDVADRLWTAPFLALTLANLCVSVTFYVLVATLAGYATAAYGANPAQAGLVSSVFFVGAMLARLVAGRVLTSRGIRPVVLGSLAALLATCLAYLLPHAMPTMLLVRVLHGIAYGFAATALASAAMRAVPPARRGEGSGWFTAGMALATGIAPFVGMTLARGGGGQGAVFAVTIGCCVVALAAAALVAGSLPARPPAGAPAGTAVRRSRVGGLVDRRALPVGAVVGLCAVPFAAILAFLSSYAAQVGLPEAASAYFLVYAGVILVSRPAAGIVQDRRGDEVVVVPIVLALALGSLLTGLAATGPVLLLAAGLLGLGYGTLTSVGQAIAVARVARERVGLGVSSYFLLVEVGTGLGPVVLGLLVEPVGYPGTFAAGAAFALAALVLYLAVVRGPRPIRGGTAAGEGPAVPRRR